MSLGGGRVDVIEWQFLCVEGAVNQSWNLQKNHVVGAKPCQIWSFSAFLSWHLCSPQTSQDDNICFQDGGAGDGWGLVTFDLFVGTASMAILPEKYACLSIGKYKLSIFRNWRTACVAIRLSNKLRTASRTAFGVLARWSIIATQAFKFSFADYSPRTQWVNFYLHLELPVMLFTSFLFSWCK